MLIGQVMEGATDRFAVLSSSIPIFKEGSYKADNSMLMQWLLPDATCALQSMTCYSTNSSHSMIAICEIIDHSSNNTHTELSCGCYAYRCTGLSRYYSGEIDQGLNVTESLHQMQKGLGVIIPPQFSYYNSPPTQDWYPFH